MELWMGDAGKGSNFGPSSRSVFNGEGEEGKVRSGWRLPNVDLCRTVELKNKQLQWVLDPLQG